MTTAKGWGLWAVVKLLLVAVVVVGGAFALAGESRPVQASHTQIYVSPTASCGVAVTSYVAFIAAPPANFYVCAKSIDNAPWGAGGVNLDVSYISWLLSVNAVVIDGPAYAGGWLDDTGRAVTCVPTAIEPNIATGQGRAYGGCHTVGTQPPYGPLTDHALAQITISAGITKTDTTINFRGEVGQPTTGTLLVSAYWEPGTPEVPFISLIIPSAVPLLAVTVTICADFDPPPSGDNYVSIFDILHLAGKFSLSSASTGWNPDWDMDGNDYVNIYDILTAARQFGRFCSG